MSNKNQEEYQRGRVSLVLTEVKATELQEISHPAPVGFEKLDGFFAFVECSLSVR